MKSRILVALAVVAALGFGSLALAADETLSGKVTCARCTLKKAGVKDCADEDLCHGCALRAARQSGSCEASSKRISLRRRNQGVQGGL